MPSAAQLAAATRSCRLSVTSSQVRSRQTRGSLDGTLADPHSKGAPPSIGGDPVSIGTCGAPSGGEVWLCCCDRLPATLPSGGECSAEDVCDGGIAPLACAGAA